MSTVFGRSLFGHLIYAGPDGGGIGSIDTSVPEFYPGQFTVIAYSKNGTKNRLLRLRIRTECSVQADL